MHKRPDRDTVDGVRARLAAVVRSRRVQAAGDVALAFVLATTSVGFVVLGGDHVS